MQFDLPVTSGSILRKNESNLGFRLYVFLEIFRMHLIYLQWRKS